MPTLMTSPPKLLLQQTLDKEQAHAINDANNAVENNGGLVAMAAAGRKRPSEDMENNAAAANGEGDTQSGPTPRNAHR